MDKKVSEFLNWLENQKRIGVELEAPVGERELLQAIIDRYKDLKDSQLEEKDKALEELKVDINDLLTHFNEKYGDYQREIDRLQEENQRLKEIITQMRESTWNDIKTIQKLQADNE